MYAIGLINSEVGYVIRSGKLGIQILRNKTMRGWLSETRLMRGEFIDRVYIIDDLPQKMCEECRTIMDLVKLSNYVMKIGQRIK